MTLSQVEAFRAVVLSGSTTAAARVLHTSQPNVSRLISQLEKAIGLRLFDRSPGKLTLTDEGQAFYDDVQRSFVGLEQLDDSAHKIRRFGTGQLRIAAVATIALGMLPRAVKRFAQRYPDVALSIHTGHSSTIAQWVESRFCDLGVVSQLSSQHYATQPEVLYEVDGVCMMPVGHRLAAKDRVHVTDLEGEAFISVAQHDLGRRLVDRIFEDAGVSRRTTIETPYSSISFSLAALGMGVCIVNPLAAQDYRDAPVVTRPFSPSVPFRGTLLFPAGRPANRMATEFAEVLRAVAREESEALRQG